MFGTKREEVTGDCGSQIMSIFMICIIQKQPFSGDEIKKNENGRACSTYGWRRRENSVLVGNLIERDHLEDRELEGWIRIQCTLTSGVRDMDYILVAQDRDIWQAFVYSVMNLRFL
jgi:hypothetical protein